MYLFLAKQKLRVFRLCRNKSGDTLKKSVTMDTKIIFFQALCNRFPCNLFIYLFMFFFFYVSLFGSLPAGFILGVSVIGLFLPSFLPSV